MAARLTVHMVVRNEDQWVWFALQSVLPYADQILVSDTGSTDHTVDCIRAIASPKIQFEQTNITNANGVTAVRQKQINLTRTDWIWIVDGDEVYPEKTAREVVKAATDKYEGVVVRRYDLLGDIYHRQKETVGEYHLYGERGHLVTRLINKKKIPDLSVAGTYPNEGYFDRNGVSLQDHDAKKWYITKNYLYHAMYLKRSSSGGNLAYVFNRKKYKIETGMKIEGTLPEVFSLARPSFISDPTKIRSRVYELTASVVTPIKNLKRAVL